LILGSGYALKFGNVFGSAPTRTSGGLYGHGVGEWDSPPRRMLTE
jgi:hypothetical protein